MKLECQNCLSDPCLCDAVDDTTPEMFRELIIGLRGGVPSKCDFCGEERNENEMHPEEAGEWACIYCMDRWEAEETPSTPPPTDDSESLTKRLGGSER